MNMMMMELKLAKEIVQMAVAVLHLPPLQLIDTSSP